MESSIRTSRSFMLRNLMLGPSMEREEQGWDRWSTHLLVGELAVFL